MNRLFIPRFDLVTSSTTPSIALFLLRLITGVAFLFHGYGKITSPFNWMGPEGFPGFLQALSALAEFGGGLCLLVGLLTPFVSLALIVNMTVAILAFHLPKGDPYMGGFELPLSYLGIFILLFATGPGRFSLDYRFFRS